MKKEQPSDEVSIFVGEMSPFRTLAAQVESKVRCDEYFLACRGNIKKFTEQSRDRFGIVATTPRAYYVSQARDTASSTFRPTNYVGAPAV